MLKLKNESLQGKTMWVQEVTAEHDESEREAVIISWGRWKEAEHLTCHQRLLNFARTIKHKAFCRPQFRSTVSIALRSLFQLIFIHIQLLRQFLLKWIIGISQITDICSSGRSKYHKTKSVIATCLHYICGEATMKQHHWPLQEWWNRSSTTSVYNTNLRE